MQLVLSLICYKIAHISLRLQDFLEDYKKKKKKVASRPTRLSLKQLLLGK